jgi:hypothetical protein
MKIIKRKSDNVVIIADNNLNLSIDGARGDDWWAPEIHPSEHILENMDTLPNGFIPSKWTYTNGVWARTQDEEVKQLEVIKKQKLKELSLSHDNAIYADIVYNNTTFKADQYSQDLLVKVLAVGSVPPNMYWRDKTGKQKTMSLSDLRGLAGKILERALIADGNLMAKIDILNNASTVAEVSNVNW